jgi:hypothetical protein
MPPQPFDLQSRSPEIVRHAQEQLKSILARSAVDLEFRRKLLTDPRAALEEATGSTLPESLRIRFIESEGYATIVLPDVLTPSDELAEDGPTEAAGGVASTLAEVAGLDIDAIVAAISAGALPGPGARPHA